MALGFGHAATSSTLKVLNWVSYFLFIRLTFLVRDEAQERLNT